MSDATFLQVVTGFLIFEWVLLLFLEPGVALVAVAVWGISTLRNRSAVLSRDATTSPDP